MSIRLHATKRLKADLIRKFDAAARHPARGALAPHPHSGNARIGAPLALVAVIGGILSYMMLDRPSSLGGRGEVAVPLFKVVEVPQEKDWGRISLGPALSIKDLPQNVDFQYVDFRVEPLTLQQMEMPFSSKERVASFSFKQALLPKQKSDHVDVALLEKKSPKEAFKYLLKLSQKHPENASVVAQLGMVSAQIGREKEALRYMRSAATLEPEKAAHIYNIAVMIDRRGAHKQALSLYQKALETDAAYGAGRSIPRERIYDRLYYLRRL